MKLELLLLLCIRHVGYILVGLLCILEYIGSFCYAFFMGYGLWVCFELVYIIYIF